MTNSIVFNAETFANDQRLAGNAWRTAEGKADNFARSATAALVTSALSPLALAISVYDEMKPKTAKGTLAEPKESANSIGGVSVSSLRSAKGGEGARSCLEAILYVYDNRALDMDAVSAFILNEKGAHKLFGLKKHLAKAKADAAKAEKEAAVPASSEEREGDEPETAASPVSPLVEAIEFLRNADGDALRENEVLISDMLKACQEAAQRLAAADELEIQKAA